jgi:hypothetical protein
MSEDKKSDFVIPALLTAAAVYFGLKKRSSTLSVITKQAVDMVIDHEVNVNPNVKPQTAPKLLLTNGSSSKRKRRRRR